MSGEANKLNLEQPSQANAFPSTASSSSASESQSSSESSSSSSSAASSEPIPSMEGSTEMDNLQLEPEVATILRALAPEEIDMLRDAFIYMDRDSDGYLSQEELFNRVCECVGESRFEPLEVYLRPLFEVADRDHDKRLSLTEFLMSFADGPGVVPAEVINTCVAGVRVRLTDEEISTLQENFRRINRKNDGFIDRAELEIALREILHDKFPDLTDTNYEEIVTVVMESADADHDGKLSLAEFIRSFQEDQGVLPAAFVDTNTSTEDDQVRVLSNEETQVLREAFAVLDKDNDGYIDFVDLYNALWEALASSMDDRNQIRDLCDLIMATADRTKRGKLTLTEFIRSFLQNMDLMLIPVAAAQEKMRSACAKLQVMHDSGELEKLVMVFEDLDRNGDGYLDRAELVEVLKQLFNDSFPEWDEATLSSVMTAVVIGAETRHDGKLSLEEFIRSFVDGPGVMPPALVDSWKSGENDESENEAEKTKEQTQNNEFESSSPESLHKLSEQDELAYQVLSVLLESLVKQSVAGQNDKNEKDTIPNNYNNQTHIMTVTLPELQEALKNALSQTKHNLNVNNNNNNNNDDNSRSMEELSAWINYIITQFGQFYNEQHIELQLDNLHNKVDELARQRVNRVNDNKHLEKEFEEQQQMENQADNNSINTTAASTVPTHTSQVEPHESVQAKDQSRISELDSKSNLNRVDLASTTANPVYHKLPSINSANDVETTVRKYKFAETYTNGEIYKEKGEYEHNISSVTTANNDKRKTSQPKDQKSEKEAAEEKEDAEEEVYVKKRGANRHPTVHAVAAELADVVSSHLRVRQSSLTEQESKPSPTHEAKPMVADSNISSQNSNIVQHNNTVAPATHDNISPIITIATQPGIIQAPVQGTDIMSTALSTEKEDTYKKSDSTGMLTRPQPTKSVKEITKMMQMTSKPKRAIIGYEANVNPNPLFEDEMRKLFQMYDVDHKGYLDRNAFKKTYMEMEQYGVEPLPSVVDAQFRRYSRGSNKIYFNEFCILMLQRIRM